MKKHFTTLYSLAFIFGIFSPTFAADDPGFTNCFTQETLGGFQYYKARSDNALGGFSKTFDILNSTNPAFWVQEDTVFENITHDGGVGLFAEGNDAVTGLQINANKTLQLKGNANNPTQMLYVTSTSLGAKAIGIDAEGRLDIAGNLVVSATSNPGQEAIGIDHFENIQIGTGKSITATATKGNDVIAIQIGENYTIKNNTITATATTQAGGAKAIDFGNKTFTVENGTIEATAKITNNSLAPAFGLLGKEFVMKQGQITVNAEAKDKAAKGIDTHTLTLGENGTVNLTSKATSIDNEASAVHVTNLDLKQGKIVATTKGNTRATAVKTSDIDMGKSASIFAKAEATNAANGVATALEIHSFTNLHNITATAKAKHATALEVRSSGTIRNANLYAKTTDTSSGKAIALDINQAGAKVELDNSGTNSVIVGNINTANNVQLDLKLAGHNTFGYSEGLGSQCNIALDKNAIWENTRNTQTTVENLHGAIGSKIKMSNGDIKIKNLSGEDLQAQSKLSGNNVSGGQIEVENIEKSTPFVVLSHVAADQNKINSLKAAGKLEQIWNDLTNQIVYTKADGKLKKFAAIWNTNSKNWLVSNKTAKSMLHFYSQDFIRDSAPSITQSLVMEYRAEMNNLNKRLGELRLAGTNRGMWGRIYGGKNTAKKVGSTEFKHASVQLGYDQNIIDDWITGTAFSYTNGQTSGDGIEKCDARNMTLGVYATRQQKNSYLDVIAKYGLFMTDLKTKSLVLTDTDFTNHALVVSAEYGRRLGFKNFSLEPQLEVIFGHILNNNYDLPTNIETLSGKQNFNVQNDGYTSLITRAGLSVGNTAKSYSWHLGASAYHEFLGDMTTKAGGTEATLKGGDTWGGVELGGAKRFGKSTMLYGSFEKTFAGDYNDGWQGEVGVRYSF